MYDRDRDFDEVAELEARAQDQRDRLSEYAPPAYMGIVGMTHPPVTAIARDARRRQAEIFERRDVADARRRHRAANIITATIVVAWVALLLAWWFGVA